MFFGRVELQSLPRKGFIQSVLFWLLEKNPRQLGSNLPPKQALQLVQSSFANRYIVKAILGWAMAVAVHKASLSLLRIAK